ncbi:hypothetical protein GCM10007298_21110 [Williamsia phyllosphaerae]|uniref:Uncharacterized protein n=1 Tax=Williamsia phyllosphaerae TaxID=885042 RepID=A0ABQ1UQY5_9NOCA|nr:hypothetical protein GCM10007298_21110 [Williamsia phyllosphaerae]
MTGRNPDPAVLQRRDAAEYPAGSNCRSDMRVRIAPRVPAGAQACQITRCDRPPDLSVGRTAVLELRRREHSVTHTVWTSERPDEIH